MTEPLVITQSSIKAYRHCLRCWYLGQYRCLVRRDDYKSTTNIGNLVHDALADYYAGGANPVASVDMATLGAVEGTQDPQRMQDLTSDGELAHIMVEGYLEWLEEEGADYELEFIEPEKSLSAMLLPEREAPGFANRYGMFPAVVLLGKLDGRVRTRDGTRLFLEHKTVSNFVDLPRFAPTEPQYLTYHLLELLTQRALGVDGDRTDGALLNMLKKVKRTSRATPPFYVREPIHHNIHELRNHWKHTIEVAEQMQVTIARLESGEDIHRVVPPSAPTRDCLYMCSFNELCLSGIMDDGSDFEGMVEALYEPGDPLARYRDDPVGVE